MTKDKYLLSVIDDFIAPITVVCFVYENYSHKDYSECFRKILKYYQIYMSEYDKAMAFLEEKDIPEEMIDTLLLCELNKMKHKFIKKFFSSLEKEIVKKHDFKYDIHRRYVELQKECPNELCVYIEILKELRQMEESGS